MLPTLNIGPLALPTAPLIYLLGAWLALSSVEYGAGRLKLDVQATYNMAALALAAGFLGSRLVFVVLHWSAYQSNLIGIVWPLTSGYDLWGGLFFAGISAILYGRYRQLPLFPTLDALAPGLISAMIIVSLADFLGGPGYGTETAVLWAIDVFGITRHPVQIYEILFGLIALLLWRLLLNKRLFPGELFLAAFIVYSAGRLVVDAYRANSWLTASGFHIVQIISLIILLAAVYTFGRQYGLNRPNDAE